MTISYEALRAGAIACAVLAVLLCLATTHFAGKYEDAKELAGVALKIDRSYLGKVFLPRKFYQRKAGAFGGAVYLMEAATNNPNDIKLFEISDEDFKVLNDDAGGRVFTLNLMIVPSGKEIFYFEKVPNSVDEVNERFKRMLGSAHGDINIG